MSYIWKVIITAIISLIFVSSIGAYAILEFNISYTLIEVSGAIIYIIVGYLLYKNHGYFQSLSAVFLIMIVAFVWDFFLLWNIEGLWHAIPDLPPIEEMEPVIYVLTFFFGIIYFSVLSIIGACVSRVINGPYSKLDKNDVQKSIKIPVINSRLIVVGYALLVILIISLIILLFSKNSIDEDSLNNKSLIAEYDLSRKAYERGDYSTALDLILPLANNGYAKAQNSLGYLYLEGQGVQQNYTQAIRWFTKAAEQGSLKAQTSLGYMHELGLGVPKDLIKATKFYRRAAEQGYTKAQYNLGLVYLNSFNGSQDYIQAYAWLDIATINGYEPARESRDDLGIKFNQMQIKEARKLADELIDKYSFKKENVFK